MHINGKKEKGVSRMKDFKGIPTTCISDSTKGLYNMDPSIRSIREGVSIAGRAFTVKMPVGDNTAVLRAIQAAQPGDIIVVDAKGDPYRAVVGDLFAGMAKTLGIQAMVIDGAVRDIQGVRDLDFPIFCSGTTMAASGKAGGGDINVPISCGGAAVSPGDIIVGDENGVLVIPRDREEEVWEQSKKQQDIDDERAARIIGNVEETQAFLADILKKFNKSEN